MTTECANCRTVSECKDDGEAYVCVNDELCQLRCERDDANIVLTRSGIIGGETLLVGTRIELLCRQLDKARNENEQLRRQLAEQVTV